MSELFTQMIQNDQSFQSRTERTFLYGSRRKKPPARRLPLWETLFLFGLSVTPGPPHQFFKGGGAGIKAPVGVIGQGRRAGFFPALRLLPGCRRRPAAWTPAHHSCPAVDTAPSVSFCHSTSSEASSDFSVQVPRQPMYSLPRTSWLLPVLSSIRVYPV